MNENASLSGWNAFRRRSIHLLAIAGILGGLCLTRLHGYLLFHSLAEMFAIAVGCTIFMLAWNARRFVDNGYLLFLGIAYLFVAALDAVHALAYKDMGVFPDRGTNLPTQLWIAARYIEAISLLIAPVLIGRKLIRPGLTLAIFSGITAAILVSVFGPPAQLAWMAFPDCHLGQVKGLTTFKIVSEYIICGILLCALGMLLVRRKRLNTQILHLIAASIILTILAELSFTRYASVYGFFNMLGHIFKVLSFYLIYRALINTSLTKPYSSLFRELAESESSLHIERDFVSAVLQTAGALVVVLDPEGCIVRFNRACEKATGYSFEEVKGKQFWDLFLDHDEVAPLNDRLQDIQGRQQPIRYESDWIAKDRTHHRIAWTNTAIMDPNG